MERPSRNEIEMSLCRMVVEERRKKEEFRKECKEKQELWMRMDRGYKEWEEDLARREKKISDHDEGLERMMRDLKIREEQIVKKNVEIEGLKSEVAKMGDCAREDNRREFQVIQMIVVCD